MKKLLATTVGIFFCVLIVIVFLFLFEGENFLSIADDISSLHADAVVILAGGPREDKQRILEGVDLLRRGKVRYVILPLRHKSFTWSWVVKNYRLGRNISESSVFIGGFPDGDRRLDNPYGGTYIEAQNTVQIMHQHQLRSAIIVSSSYHMRRSKLAFESARIQLSPRFYYHPVKNRTDDIWWMNKKYVWKVLGEYKKLIGACFIY